MERPVSYVAELKALTGKVITADSAAILIGLAAGLQRKEQKKKWKESGSLMWHSEIRRSRRKTRQKDSPKSAFGRSSRLEVAFCLTRS